MNRYDIELLQAVRGYPAVSILVPTHRTHTEMRQDQLRVKNLVNEATNRLLAEFPRREVEALLSRLDALVNEIDFYHLLDGLALFVNRDFAREFVLPFSVQERVVIDESFATRDLVFAFNRSPRYWALVLSEKPTRLYEGSRDTLVEITNDAFPMTHTGPGGTEPLPGGFGVRKSAYRDEAHRQFFRKVDAAFTQAAAADPLPLVVVGVDRYLAFFKEVSANTKHIVGTVTGSHGKTPAHRLAKLVWRPVQEHFAAQRAQALGEMEQAVAAHRVAFGIHQSWTLARQGRGAMLLVEQDFHFPARLAANGEQLLAAEDTNAADVMDDAVDEIIEAVLSKGGRVVFVENGALAQRERMALVLRY